MATGPFRVQYPIEAYDGGKNNKYDPNIIADNESPDCLNVVYDDLGGMQTRGGSRKLNTNAVGSFAGDGLFTVRFNDATEKMVGWWNGSMYQWTGSTFATVPSAQSVFTAGTRVDMVQYQNLAFFGNGGASPYKWNGTEFTRHGIPAPNSTPAAISGTAAANRPPTGDINYKVTYENSYAVEGDVSTFTATLTLANSASVSLTSIPLAPASFGVAARVLYRLDSTTSGQYLRVTRIADNTTTNFTDTISAASLTVTAPTDQGEPPNWSMAKTHQERIFMLDPAEPSIGYYTELTNPFVVKAANFVPMGNGDGERVRGISIHADSVVYHKQAGHWLIYMPDTDPANWLRKKTNSKYGTWAHHAIVDYGQFQMFIGERYGVVAGFMALAGVETQPDPVALSITGVYSEAMSDRIEPDVFNFNRTLLDRACGVEFKNKLWFSVPSTGSSTENDRIYQFDFQRRDKDKTSGAWVPFTGLKLAAFTVFGGKLYGQSATANGRVYELDVAGLYEDDGAAINSYGWTKEFQGHEEHWDNHKDFRYANFIMETLGAWFMNVYHRIDSDKGIGYQNQVDLNPGGTIWGQFNWGAAQWGGGVNRRKATINLGTSSGKSIQFRFDNQNVVGQGFHVLPNSSFFYNVRGLR
jgi:hypothetical protein